MKKFFLVILLFLWGCSKTLPSIEGNSYQMFFNQIPITLTFYQNGQFSGKAINEYFGSYSVEQNNITLTLQGSTMQQAPSPHIKNEDIYFKSLKKISTFIVSDNLLILKGPDFSYQFNMLNANKMDVH